MTKYLMAPETLAATIHEMAKRRMTSTAARVRPEALPYICSRLTGPGGLSANADHEMIELALQTLANSAHHLFFDEIFPND